jgi:hypothetical protein
MLDETAHDQLPMHNSDLAMYPSLGVLLLSVQCIKLPDPMGCLDTYQTSGYEDSEMVNEKRAQGMAELATTESVTTLADYLLPYDNIEKPVNRKKSHPCETISMGGQIRS